MLATSKLKADQSRLEQALFREPKLCPECGYLLHFRADSAGRLVAYCEGCEIEIPIESVPEAVQPRA
jgi:hypothetical protein